MTEFLFSVHSVSGENLYEINIGKEMSRGVELLHAEESGLY
jgi:hypothetical protein